MSHERGALQRGWVQNGQCVGGERGRGQAVWGDVCRGRAQGPINQTIWSV